jgi:hypothetical protein
LSGIRLEHARRLRREFIEISFFGFPASTSIVGRLVTNRLRLEAIVLEIRDQANIARLDKMVQLLLDKTEPANVEK